MEVFGVLEHEIKCKCVKFEAIESPTQVSHCFVILILFEMNTAQSSNGILDTID